MKRLVYIILFVVLCLGVSSCVFFYRYPKEVKDCRIKYSGKYNPDSSNKIRKDGYYIEESTDTNICYFYEDGTVLLKSRLRDSRKFECWGLYKVEGDSIMIEYYFNDPVRFLDFRLCDVYSRIEKKFRIMKNDSLMEVDILGKRFLTLSPLPVSYYRFEASDEIPTPDSPVKKWRWMHKKDK